MLELQPKTQIEISAEQKQEYKYIGSKILKKGLKLYEIDLKEFEVKEVEIVQKVAISSNKNIVKSKQAQYKPNVIYLQALNQANAERKAEKILSKIIKELES